MVWGKGELCFGIYNIGNVYIMRRINKRNKRKSQARLDLGFFFAFLNRFMKERDMVMVGLRYLAVCVFAGAVIMGFFVGAYAKQRKEQIAKRNVAQKEVVGEVSAITPGRFIAVVYNRDIEAGNEEEILLPIDTNSTTFDHVKDLSGIAVSDTVRIQYDDEEITYDTGRKERNLKLSVILLLHCLNLSS